VNSDKQTLILAGEAIPRPAAVGSAAGDLGLPDLGLPDLGPRLTIVATRADSTMLLAHGDSTPSMTLLTGGQNQLDRSGHLSSPRGFSSNAANEYARTQDFWGNGTRSTIIDTYA
jgi:hypothetical protein